MSAPSPTISRHVFVLLNHTFPDQFVGVFTSSAAVNRYLATMGVEDSFAARSAAGYVVYGAFVQE